MPILKNAKFIYAVGSRVTFFSPVINKQVTGIIQNAAPKAIEEFLHKSKMSLVKIDNTNETHAINISDIDGVIQTKGM